MSTPLFSENQLGTNSTKGCIEIICGCMFSGKTEELIRRVKRAKIANQRVSIFKPSIDTRYGNIDIASHDANRLESIPVKSSAEIEPLVNDAQVVGIDEGQFFDDGLLALAEQLAAKGIRVIIAGLDMDYLGKPFGPIPSLMAVAEYVTKVHAVCLVCGSPATHSFRKSAEDAIVMLGEKESYEARCRHCFNAGMNRIS